MTYSEAIMLKFLTLGLFLMNEDGGAAGFGGAPMSAPAPAPEAAPAPETDGIQYQYPETLAEEYKGSATFNKFANDKGEFDYGKMMQSYAQLERTLGKDKIAVPTENSTADDWKSVFTKLGLPESVENYEVKNNLPEGFEENTEMLNGFKAAAHEAGVLPHQAQKMLDFYNEFSTNLVKDHNEAMAKASVDGFAALKQEWGEDGYENRLVRANQALSQFATESEIASLSAAGLLQNPTFAKVFDKVAIGLGEDSFTPEAKGSFGMDTAQIEDRINKVYSEIQSMGKTHPQYASKVKEYQDLFKQKHGSK